MKNSNKTRNNKTSSKKRKKTKGCMPRFSVLERIQLIRLEMLSIKFIENGEVGDEEMITAIEGKYGLVSKFSSGDVSYVGVDVIDCKTKEKEHFQMYIGRLLENSGSFSNTGAIHSFFKKMLYQNIYNIYDKENDDVSEREITILKLKELIDEEGLADIANKMHVNDLIELDIKTLNELLGAVEHNEEQKK